MDTDRSGGLDANELAEGLLVRGYSVTREEMDQLIDRMDLNQDGTIAFDEFSSALVDWKKVSDPHPGSCIFACGMHTFVAVCESLGCKGPSVPKPAQRGLLTSSDKERLRREAAIGEELGALGGRGLF